VEDGHCPAVDREEMTGGGILVSVHPLNLALRFLLEIAASLAIGYWGWHQAEGPLRYAPAILLPLTAAALWGTFRVPGDASASGDAPVAVPGVVRLGLELGLIILAVWGLATEGAPTIALVLAVTALIHYLFSYDRILWLFQQG